MEYSDPSHFKEIDGVSMVSNKFIECIRKLQTSGHKSSDVFKINFFSNILGLYIFILICNEDNVFTLLLPSILLNPVFQRWVCNYFLSKKHWLKYVCNNCYLLRNHSPTIIIVIYHQHHQATVQVDSYRLSGMWCQ